ncbi:MAG: sugar phosphate nucleotidyltransferase, partial [Planctomycetota bacterium]
MRHALIIAGGSGTRLWPMSTQALPKQLIPFIDGRSLLQIAMDRLDGLVPDERIFVCAGESTRDVMLDKLPKLHPECFIAEPTGRDTLNAVALASGVIAKRDPDAVIAVFTADHLIEPVDRFQQIVTQGYELAERD